MIAGVSTATLFGGLSGSVRLLQTGLADAQQEVSTGRRADVGRSLGAGVGRSIDLRAEAARIDGLLDDDATATTRLSATQDALTTIQASADAFQNALVAAKAGNSTPAALIATAKASLAALTATLATTVSGEPVFPGAARTSRIATGEDAVTSLTTDAAPFQAFAQALREVASLGAGSLSDPAQAVAIDSATMMTASALAGLTDTAASLGVAQARITAATTRMGATRTTIETALGGLEGVDAYAASARLADLKSRLETTYSLTAELRKLSLLQYL